MSNRIRAEPNKQKITYPSTPSKNLISPTVQNIDPEAASPKLSNTIF